MGQDRIGGCISGRVLRPWRMALYGARIVRFCGTRTAGAINSMPDTAGQQVEAAQVVIATSPASLWQQVSCGVSETAVSRLFTSACGECASALERPPKANTRISRQARITDVIALLACLTLSRGTFTCCPSFDAGFHFGHICPVRNDMDQGTVTACETLIERQVVLSVNGRSSPR